VTSNPFSHHSRTCVIEIFDISTAAASTSKSPNPSKLLASTRRNMEWRTEFSPSKIVLNRNVLGDVKANRVNGGAWSGENINPKGFGCAGLDGSEGN